MLAQKMKKITKLHPDRKAIWFIFKGDQLWFIDREGTLPSGQFKQLNLNSDPDNCCYHLDYYQQSACIVIDLQQGEVELEQGDWLDLREAMALLAPELFLMAGRAWQVINFIRTHRFCGQCGQSMIPIKWEVACQCHGCGHRAYPRVSPAVMMAVVKGDQVLLAQNKRNKAGIHSVLAGFVEVGETLEQTVAREVMEEVGLGVTNIRYFGSQPWPFPHNMMVAYIADYASGEIKIDKSELTSADWFSIDKLPEIPGHHSISRLLIEHVLKSAIPVDDSI